MTGFPKNVRDVIAARAKGICERCDFTNVGLQIHHRRPRGMGGSKDPETNTAPNGVLVCPRCHSLIESFRDKALWWGWLVRQGHSPSEVPIFYKGVWSLLADDGVVTPV